MTHNSCPKEDWSPLLKGVSWDCTNATFTTEEKVNCIYNSTNQIQLKTNLIAEQCKLDQKYVVDSDGWGVLFSISILSITIPFLISFGRTFYKRCKKMSTNLNKCSTILFYLTSFIKSVPSEIFLKLEVLISNTNLLKIESTSKKERIKMFKEKQQSGSENEDLEKRGKEEAKQQEELENKILEKREREDFDERKSKAKEYIQEIESEEAEILYITISMETYIQFFFQSLVALFPSFLLSLVTYFRKDDLFSNYENFTSSISSSTEGITIETLSLIFGYMNICQVCCKLKMREKNKSFSLKDWETLVCVLLYSTCDIVMRISCTGLLAFLLSPTNQFLWWVAILIYVIHTGLMIILHCVFTPPRERNAWAIILNAMSSFYTYNRPIRQTEELENRHKSKLQENLIFNLIVLLENVICVVVALTAGNDTLLNQYGNPVVLDSWDKGVVAIFLTLITLLGWGFRLGYYKFHPARPEMSKDKVKESLSIKAWKKIQCCQGPDTSKEPEKFPLLESPPETNSVPTIGQTIV